MAKEYSFYPGCSSQSKASSDNYLKSTQTMCEEMDIKLNPIPDWNCCSASIGYGSGGELPRISLSARNIALSQQAHGQQDIVATCAACWLATREAKERIEENQQVRSGIDEALGEIGLKVEDQMPKSRHMVEVLIEDFGYDAIKEKVKKPLDGMKVAGYVGCQTNRPFGIDGESFENPRYLDKMVETLGAEPVENYEKKVSCCGGALMFSEPEKSQALVKDIIEAAYDGGADMIVTPCPVCQMNVEVYQGQINQKYNTKFELPVVYYSTMMSVAFGRSAKDAALDGQIIKAKKLEEKAK
ncbi:MAG TPA: CoB--CoM heterodisulfide reductase iron-sulfur subunit B family protein [Gammaproteobacteria bacterium]|nr:CoB--CoM heterodisulfide reductase iron-sulfur subunit B family protein [Gammaproteobacteria bacterium]